MDTITWLGHAAFALIINEITILIDPFLNENPLSPVKADAVPADYILVSHGHADHIGDTVAIAKRTNAIVISNAEICGWLRKQGLRTHAQHLGGGFKHPFGYLKLTMALHGSGLPDGTNGGNPAGFLLFTPAGKRLYFAGDTGLFGDMKLIGDEGIDIAILPIGDNFTMGPDDALRALKMLQPRQVIPIHYNTFDIIRQDVHAWAAQVAAQSAVEVLLPEPGETLAI
jgi:L-ascorbate metabolism protein UlaG (beta-lactamase superfamily)